MKAWQKTACAAGIVLGAVATGAMITACNTPVRTKVSFASAGIVFRGEVSVNGIVTIHISGKMPPGKCMKLTGRTANGSALGSSVVTVPGSWTAPPGTDNVDIEIVDCLRPQSPGSSAASHVAGHSTQFSTGEYTEILGMPVVFDYVDGGLLKNAAYHFRVHDAGDSAWDEILPILVGGPGTPVPPTVEVLSFTQTIPETLGARVRVADTDVFTQFRLDWNGRVGYADLAQGINTVQYAAPHHWNVIETFISALDIQPFGVENSALTTRRTQLEDRAQSNAAAVLYIP